MVQRRSREHAMSDVYDVFAVKYAERTARIRAESFIMADDHTAPHPMDYFVWVVRNAQRTIVVDTGFDAAEAAKRNRTILRAPAVALRDLGIDAATVSDVVITHLHYDHAGTLDAFPAARFHLQAAEMAYATGPCMCHDHMRFPFTADHVCAMVRHVYSGRVVFYEGDAELAPGVSVHKIGGHSRGLQCVRVMTASGPVVLASDAAHYYETFEKKKPFVIVADMEDMLRGYETLVRLAGDANRVVPGHDPLVLARYPALSAATAGVVHRLDVVRDR
jgi:glyoxylase-like metal-dependent hydrolase (beta-lactamase superfamily II)